MKRLLLIACIAGVLPAKAQRIQRLTVGNLRCGFRVDPAGIEDVSPELSWEMVADRRAVVQTAYRVQVSEDSAVFRDGKAWESGKVFSDASIHVEYKGKVLPPAATCYWRVMVWDNHGDSSRWSAVARWQTGLRTPGDWKGAQWIGYEEIPDSSLMLPKAPETMKKTGPFRDVLPLFRKEFTISKKLKKATAFICGLGHFGMSLNGKTVGDHFLDPGWTTYNKRALYVVFDITDQLRQGANAIGVMLGNGFYYVPRERYNKLAVAYGYPTMKTRVILEYTDGSHEDIVSDPSWKTAPGPLLFSSTYGGEDYDARREQKGWDAAHFDDRGWKTSLVVKGPPVLAAQSEEPLKVFDHFKPRGLRKKALDTLIYDLGQNASGIPMIRVRGGRGQTVRITPGELVNMDGGVNQDGTGKPCYFDYTLKGEGVESWHPRFMYYGFRYLQVTGAVPEGSPNPRGLPVIVSIEGWHTRNAVERTGSFACSNLLFRRTDTLIDWALRSNLASVLTDCPHREKLGWLEQAHLMGSGLRYNYNIVNIYRKIIRDMMDAQTEDGLVPEIAPEFTQFYEPFRDSPEWGSSSVLVPWYLYRYYGDSATLAESYPMMARYIGYLSGKTKGGLLYQGLGDWYDLGPGDPGVSQLTPKGLTASAIYYYDLTVMEKAARMLGRPEDASRYADMAKIVRAAFNETFFNRATNQYGSGSQTANAMAVYMGLVEPGNKDAVVGNIVKDIRQHKNGLTSGDIGYRYLLKVLNDEGRSDVIYDMNSRADVPGYGYQLAHGATALTESWQALPGESNNHFMLGHIMEWFYTGLAGIREEDSIAGFRQIVLKPELTGDLSWVKGSYHSPYGRIGSYWQRDDRQLRWRISIPANSSATVHIPAEYGMVVTEGGRPLTERKDMVVTGRDKFRVIARLGSGDYDFLVEYRK